MTVARRLAAILAVDVAGYSRLMGEDEAGTAKAVRERREAATPIVRNHGGRLVKTTGDGVLLEFPSVVAAVEAAILIQKMMAEGNLALPEARRILYRIGVNLGDVLIEGDDIIGDGVNVAARLEGVCEPGGVCLSGSAYEHIDGRIEAAFADLGEQKLKNIARPIRAFGLSVEAVSAAQTQPTGAAIASAPPPSAAPHRAPHLSIVVLPLNNFGGDPDQDYFVDGVTETLTTDLSRMAGAFVIGRNTAFTYKGKSVDLKQIGRELNVRYVLEGSVQRSGERMRVNVQLIEAETGAHLWADRFDKRVADLFEMQDEIVARLSGQLRVELADAEARRAERVADPDSMELYFQGLSRLTQALSVDKLLKTRSFFERAGELDLRNVHALVGLATVDILLALGIEKDPVGPAGRFASAEATLRKVLAIAPNYPSAHNLFGLLLSLSGRSPRALETLERALALDPNLAIGHSWLGLTKVLLGRAGETEPHVHEAIRLSPRDPWAWNFYLHAGIGAVFFGDYEKASAWLHKSIDVLPHNPWAFFYLGASLALLGRSAEAEEQVRTGLAINPNYTIAAFRASFFSDHPVFVEQQQRVAAGMRMAGVPQE